MLPAQKARPANSLFILTQEPGGFPAQATQASISDAPDANPDPCTQSTSFQVPLSQNSIQVRTVQFSPLKKRYSAKRIRVSSIPACRAIDSTRRYLPSKSNPGGRNFFLRVLAIVDCFPESINWESVQFRYLARHVWSYCLPYPSIFRKKQKNP